MEEDRKKTKKMVQGEQPRQGSHRGGYKRDKLSRFFLPLQLPHGREYKQVFPGEFSRLVHTAPIENLRQFRRASMYPRETSSGRARRRESCGKMQEKGGERRSSWKRRKVPKRCRARCRSIPRKNAFWGPIHAAIVPRKRECMRRLLEMWMRFRVMIIGPRWLWQRIGNDNRNTRNWKFGEDVQKNFIRDEVRN